MTNSDWIKHLNKYKYSRNRNFAKRPLLALNKMHKLCKRSFLLQIEFANKLETKEYIFFLSNNFQQTTLLRVFDGNCSRFFRSAINLSGFAIKIAPPARASIYKSLIPVSSNLQRVFSPTTARIVRLSNLCAILLCSRGECVKRMMVLIPFYLCLRGLHMCMVSPKPEAKN